MARLWVTTMSTHPESVVNPLIAACEAGYVPTEIRLLSNPSVEGYVATVRELFAAVTTAYGRQNTDIAITELETETDFKRIVDHFRDPIPDEDDDGPTVAVDVTPGRKFMSAIAFQAGIQFGADHVYYLHLDSGDYFGQVYSTIPRSATDLIDFQELFD
ncbi:CRISPR-associated ring nuclease [Haloglomus halophilum]|uniref:CRISPR-associated ring nuclease n=1 Tax=Haloglomus halophilum TaxID=2962672 RepID=UPI0020C95543|nr:CRISPR-associated ring nuclease [Haloglomus halophilum]